MVETVMKISQIFSLTVRVYLHSKSQTGLQDFTLLLAPTPSLLLNYISRSKCQVGQFRSLSELCQISSSQ